jgi:hypothetical protein
MPNRNYSAIYLQGSENDRVVTIDFMPSWLKIPYTFSHLVSVENFNVVTIRAIKLSYEFLQNSNIYKL